jgi:hypothetical protein
MLQRYNHILLVEVFLVPCVINVFPVSCSESFRASDVDVPYVEWSYWDAEMWRLIQLSS